LEPGETYQHPVKLARVPNVPLAEVWCQRLRQNGIEAFYKGSSLPRASLVEGGGRDSSLGQRSAMKLL
jgi:hypothetical protein